MRNFTIAIILIGLAFSAGYFLTTQTKIVQNTAEQAIKYFNSIVE